MMSVKDKLERDIKLYKIVLLIFSSFPRGKQECKDYLKNSTELGMTFFFSEVDRKHGSAKMSYGQ